MGRRQDITEYVKGETVAIGLQFRNRDNDALNLTGVTMTLIITELPGGKGRKLAVLTDEDIEVENAVTGAALAILPPERQSLLRAGVDYWYDLWSESDERLHQANGTFRLRDAAQP